ncbi:hypothetical protein BGX31_010386 [Mortierella sp. GBA43]|nr:hypothetical protein BGX31_010386 [Mortierella sp. GBA43]
MGVFPHRWVCAKTNNPRIASLWIITAFIMASAVKANPFDKGFGVGMNTFTTLPKMTSLSQKDYVPNKVVVSVKLGLSSGNETAIAPGVAAYDSTGSSVFTWGMDNDPCDDEDDHIKVNKTSLFQERPKSTGGIASFRVSAHDRCAPKGDPVCMSSVVVLPSTGNNKSDPVYLSGNILAECGAAWYWGADSFDGFDDNCDRVRVRERCVWMSQVPQKFLTLGQVEISDTAAFLRENEGTVRPSCTSNLRLTFLNGTEMETGQKNATKSVFDYAFYNNVDSAEVLCFSLTSYGPSFLSLKESKFCDIPTRKTFPLCNSDATQGCVKRNESLLTFIPGPSGPTPLSLARPMPLRFLGPSEATNSTTGSPTNTTLDTGKEPSCQPIQRDKLSVGEKLWAGEDLVSNDRNVLLTLGMYGDIITHFKKEGHLYQSDTLGLRRYVIDRWSLTYHVELQEDGRICAQVWNTTGQRCIGKALAKDNYSLALHNSGFLYVKKPSGEVVQTDLCPVLTSIRPGRMVGYCFMSSDQSIMAALTPAGKLGYFRTKDDYIVKGAGQSTLDFQRDGKLQIIAGTTNKTQVLFNGGLPDDDYELYVTNDHEIVINGSDGQPRWTTTLFLISLLVQ